jgi:autotransporter-associated beta strand protein
VVGPGTLIKTGAGTLTLTTTDSLGNIYAGGTQISNGTLRVNTTSAASGTGAGAVTVGSGGTLGGIGSIIPNTGSIATNLVTVNTGGTLDPGAAASTVGTLTIGSEVNRATVQINGTYLAHVAGLSGSDLVAITGDLVLGALSVLDLSSAGNTYTPGASYTLLSYTGDLTGTFGSTVGMPVDYFIDYGVPLGGGTFGVVLTPIPEPALGLVVAAAGLGYFRYRRRQAAPTEAVTSA